MKYSKTSEILICCIFVAAAFVSFLYVKVLPSLMPDDEIGVLLADKAAADTSFPQRDLLLHSHYDTYLYYPLIADLTAHFDIQTYRSVLLFAEVFLTGYACYLALRMLKIRRTPAVITALIALLPRLSIGSTFWGVFTNQENLGRSLAFPVMWLLGAWHVRRIQEKKSLGPVFLAIGLTSYIHPVSMIFFAGLLLIATFAYLAWDREWWYGLKQSLQGLAVFMLGAAPLLIETFGRTKMITATVGFASRLDYAKALDLRLYWEYPPHNLVWLKAIFVISFFFLVFITAVWWMMKKRNAAVPPLYAACLRWSFLVASIGVFLSIFLPAAQFFAIEHFDAPLVIQQVSRFFIYFYLGLFTAFAVMLDYLWGQVWDSDKKRFIGGTLVLCAGLTSSSIGSQWLQFLTGYDYSQESYIPSAFHKDNVGPNDFDFYPKVCDALHSFGASTTTVVIADDERIRYFCDVPLYVTFKIGESYLNSGKKALVDWMNMYVEQKQILGSGDAQDVLDLAKKAEAGYAVLDASSTVAKGLTKMKIPVKIVGNLEIISFSTSSTR